MPFLKGQLIYCVTWGAKGKRSHAYRATRNECLAEFLNTGARKCSLSANECGGDQDGIITILYRLRDPKQGTNFREEFTRKQAQEAVSSGRFASDVPTMLPELQTA